MTNSRQIFISPQNFEALLSRCNSHEQNINSVITELLRNSNNATQQESSSSTIGTVGNTNHRRKNYAFRVLNHEGDTGRHKGAQTEALKIIIQLIAATDPEFSMRFAQADATKQKCIARSEGELCGETDYNAIRPKPILLNNERWFLFTNCDLERKIKYMIIACHTANLAWGEDVVLLGDVWSVHDKKGDPKERAEQWARDEELIR